MRSLPKKLLSRRFACSRRRVTRFSWKYAHALRSCRENMRLLAMTWRASLLSGSWLQTNSGECELDGFTQKIFLQTNRQEIILDSWTSGAFVHRCWFDRRIGLIQLQFQRRGF